MTYTLQEILNLTAAHLKKQKIENARRQAEMLLCDALSLQRIQLYTEFDRPISESELALCRERLQRRSKGEPLAYIHGSVQFFDCTIQVNRSTLIPRQETEILVDNITKELSSLDLNQKSLWDLCCGSGCIGIALKKRFPELTVFLSDRSKEALQTAKANAEINAVNLSFLEGDLLSPFEGLKTDFLVCNPPYIAEREYQQLDREVRDFEPKSALVSGESGLEFYQRLSKELPPYLNKGAKVWFEIGARQGASVVQFFSTHPWIEPQVSADFAGHDRLFSIEMGS